MTSSARKEKNKNLRSPYKAMNRDLNGTGPARSRTDEDAISAENGLARWEWQGNV